MKQIIFSLVFLLAIPMAAFAGDAATLVFKSGQVVMIDDGYRQIVDAMRGRVTNDDTPKIVELNIGGGSFLLNASEVVIVCRDDCRSLRVKHQLDPARSKESGHEVEKGSSKR